MGATANPPTLAPVGARLSARPRWRSNQCAKIVEIAVELIPAQPHDEVAWIELPWFGGMAEVDRAGAQKNGAA